MAAELTMRIDNSELAALMEQIEPQIKALPEAHRAKLLADFKDMKPYDIDMVRMEMRDGVMFGVVTEEFKQHLRANGVDV